MSTLKSDSELSIADLKEKEKILWDELRNIREIGLRLLQWGVTVLATLQTAIFFFRKDLYQRMQLTGQLGNIYTYHGIGI